MIDLNNKDTKNYFNNLIDNEISNIAVSLNKQKELNIKLLNCFDHFSKMTSDTLTSASSELVSISQLLNKISFNFSSFAKLLDELENIKKSISIADTKTINDIEQYNQKSSNIMKKISINVMRIEEFLAQSNPIYNLGINLNTPIPTEKVISEEVVNNDVAIHPITQDSNITNIPVDSSVSTNNISPSEVSEILKVVDELPPKQGKRFSEDSSDTLQASPKEATDAAPELLFDIAALLAKASQNSHDQVKIEEEITNKNMNPEINYEPEEKKELSSKVSEFLSNDNDGYTSALFKKDDEEKSIDKDKSFEAHVEIPEPSEPTENTLIISESEGIVTLPYKIEELTKILEEHPDKYNSLEEVIDKFYTRPLKYYKSSSTARFKEAYKLVRKKEGGSIGEALDLGVELFSNYNLHPAIISACKNLNELDIYLSCLEYNELEDFKFFKIVFNVAPVTAKKSFRKESKKQPKPISGPKTALEKETVQKGKHSA